MTSSMSSSLIEAELASGGAEPHVNAGRAVRPRRRSRMERMSYVVPFRPLSEEIELTISRTAMMLLFLSVVLTSVLVFVILPGEVECMKDAPKWKFLLMLNLVILFCVLVVDGKGPEFTVLGISALAVLCDCLDPADLWAGAASDAVISLALLFPIAKSMADTGVPAAFIGSLLGNPTNIMPGIARMFMALLLPNAVFNNTPIVAMMIPVMRSWSERLGFNLRALLMPLSFCAQAGGNMTLMSSSINFVAASIFSSASGGTFQMGFFSLSLGGIFLYALVAVYCTLMAPRIMKAEEETANAPGAAQPQGPLRSRYIVPLVVTPGPLIGVTPEIAGLHRIKGVSVGAATKLERDGDLIGESWDAIRSQPFEVDDILQVATTAEGVAALRFVKGLELCNQSTELGALGAGRRRRILVEASVANGFVGEHVNVRAMKHTYHSAVVAVASPSIPHLCQMSYQGYTVQPGDVFLIEAFKEELGSEGWLKLFSVVRAVPNSSPPALGRKPDQIRALCTGLGLLTVVGLSIFAKERLSLPVTCVLLLCFLFSIKALHPAEAYSAINGSVLMTIVGALALGQALQRVHVADCFAASVVSVARPFGDHAILAALYIATGGLGMFITNAAVVAIMGAIGCSIAMAPESTLTLGEVCLTVVYGASACWCTPFGYQTNLMVAKEVGYTWGEFIRFGFPLQVLHLVVTVLIAPICAKYVF